MNFCISNSKTYLLAIALFCGSFLLLFVLSSEWLLRTKVEPAEHLSKHLQLLNHSTLRQAIVGDSRVARGFNHDEFVNLGWPGDHLARTAQKLRSYADRIPLDRVILAVDALVFAEYRHQALNQQAAEWPLQMPVWRLSHPYYRQNLNRYWQRWLQGRGFTNRYQWHPNGWQSTTDNWADVPKQDRQTRANARAVQHMLMADFATHPFTTLLTQLIDQLQANGTVVCLLSMPVSSEYRQAMQKQPNDAAIKIWIAELAMRKNIAYRDFSGLFANNADHFMDFDHLNQRGTAAFSAIAVNTCFE